jgi:hypothetical protein
VALTGVAFGGLLSAAAGGCFMTAPTCGPCCHDPEGAECQAELDAGDIGLDDDAGQNDDAGILAPTCGPCCHSPELPECADGGTGA